jgi:hypothetical protein
VLVRFLTARRLAVAVWLATVTTLVMFVAWPRPDQHAHEAAESHGPDPVSAALLVIDGAVVLGAVVLLLVKPKTRPSRVTGPGRRDAA